MLPAGHLGASAGERSFRRINLLKRAQCALEWGLRPWAGAAWGRDTAFSMGVVRYPVKFACTKAYPARDVTAQSAALAARVMLRSIASC